MSSTSSAGAGQAGALAATGAGGSSASSSTPKRAKSGGGGTSSRAQGGRRAACLRRRGASGRAAGNARPARSGSVGGSPRRPRACGRHRRAGAAPPRRGRPHPAVSVNAPAAAAAGGAVSRARQRQHLRRGDVEGQDGADGQQHQHDQQRRRPAGEPRNSSLSEFPTSEYEARPRLATSAWRRTGARRRTTPRSAARARGPRGGGRSRPISRQADRDQEGQRPKRVQQQMCVGSVCPR